MTLYDIGYIIFFSDEELGTNERSCVWDPRWFQEFCYWILSLWLAFSRTRFYFCEWPFSRLIFLKNGLKLISNNIGKLKKVSSTYALDHYELFGLRQGLKMGDMLKAPGTGENFVTLMHYKLVRHPIMTGFFIMFWSVPIMTMGKFTHIKRIFIFYAVIFKRFNHWSSNVTIGYIWYGKLLKATFYSR